MSYKYKFLIARLAEKYDLSSAQYTSLAIHLGLKWYPRPKNVPESWKLILCKSYHSQRYLNLEDKREYTVVKPPVFLGGLPYILHHTQQGFVDAKWFYEIVPQLDKIITMPSNREANTGPLFSKSFNAAVNKEFENQREGKGMTQGQVEAINLFFEKFVPGLDCICSSCFKVSLPRTGAGERWTHRENEDYEVRISAAKPFGQEGQKVEYVSHRELDQNQKWFFALWDSKNKQRGFDKDMNQEYTHIPWDIYDFNKFKMRMPICKCHLKKKF